MSASHHGSGRGHGTDGQGGDGPSRDLAETQRTPPVDRSAHQSPHVHTHDHKGVPTDTTIMAVTGAAMSIP